MRPTRRPAIPSDAPRRRWPQEVTTSVTLSTANDAYVVDDIALPADNPWRRNVRAERHPVPSDGTASCVTLDGDVWFVRGLHEPAAHGRWRRFASGLHEPLTLAIRDEQVYVFDRNGIWRLRDTNGDGEADVHELFSNAFAQTADMREFPSTLRLAPGGEFVIAKGGQEATTLGKHNGSVLRVSADGRQATVLGYGFRQPKLGVNLRTGLVTASDQQGHYIPSTPLHIVRDRQFYGFLSDKLPREDYPAPIADPLTWIPHAVNASAMSQVWLFDARMGPLNDGLVHIGFNNPELFRVLLNNRGTTAAGRRRERHARVRVSAAQRLGESRRRSALHRRVSRSSAGGRRRRGWPASAACATRAPRRRCPREVVPMDKGVLLRFDVGARCAKAADPDSYSVTSWHYQRTYQYGSPQLKADGTPGIDRLAPSSAYLSKDGRSVFIGVPGHEAGRCRCASAGRSRRPTGRRSRTAPTSRRTNCRRSIRSPRASATSPSICPRSRGRHGDGRAGERARKAGACISSTAASPATRARPTTVSKLGPTFKGLYGSERTFAAASSA